MRKFNKIILINEITFIIATLTFFYLGADTIPPFGFIGLVISVLLFAVIQYFYLKKFIEHLDKNTPNMFIKNLLLFVMLGICVTLAAIMINTIKINYLDYTIITFNLVIISLLFIFYSVYLYIFNIILLKIIK